MILWNIFMRIPPDEFFSKFSVLFGHQVKNIFFALIKKIFLQSLVEMILRYHTFFLGFRDSLGPPYEQNENFCM